MYREQFCNFETCERLKQEGFNWKCYDFYEVEYTIPRQGHAKRADPVDWNGEDDENCYSRPTLQMAKDWVQEAYKVFLEIRCGENDGVYWYDFDIIPTDGTYLDTDIELLEYPIEGDAIEAGINCIMEHYESRKIKLDYD